MIYFIDCNRSDPLRINLQLSLVTIQIYKAETHSIFIANIQICKWQVTTFPRVIFEVDGAFHWKLTIKLKSIFFRPKLFLVVLYLPNPGITPTSSHEKWKGLWEVCDNHGLESEIFYSSSKDIVFLSLLIIVK